jgi:hypothetical protein
MIVYLIRETSNSSPRSGDMFALGFEREISDGSAKGLRQSCSANTMTLQTFFYEGDLGAPLGFLRGIFLYRSPFWL